MSTSNPLAFQPEPKETLHARFAAALSPGYLRSIRPQDAPGLNRKHVFDMEDGVRMVVSLDLADEETKHLMGDAIHFSFGLAPSVAQPRSVEDFARQAYRLIVEFWHKPQVLETLMTERALHVWCKPDEVIKA
jgi:hypothetical protein